MDSEDAFTTTNLVKASLATTQSTTTTTNSHLTSLTADKSEETEITLYEEETEKKGSVPVNIHNEIDASPLQDDKSILETSTLITTTTTNDEDDDVKNFESVPDDLHLSTVTLTSGSETSTLDTNDMDNNLNDFNSNADCTVQSSNIDELIDEDTLVESMQDQTLAESERSDVCDLKKAETISNENVSTETFSKFVAIKSPVKMTENEYSNVCQDAMPSTSSQNDDRVSSSNTEATTDVNTKKHTEMDVESTSDQMDIDSAPVVQSSELQRSQSQIEVKLDSSLENNLSNVVQNTSVNIFSEDDLSNDSDQLIIDQEAAPPAKASQTKDTSQDTMEINGFDFNNYLKRKICATIEESIGKPTKKRRLSRVRKKKNGNALHDKDLPAPQNKIMLNTGGPPTNNILEYLLENKHNKLLDSSGATGIIGNNKDSAIIDLEKTKDFESDLFPVGQFQTNTATTLPVPMVSSTEMSTTLFPSVDLTHETASITNTLEDSKADCLALVPYIPPSTSLASQQQQSRLRIYKCSSCNKLFENWNLFLHMRQVHKKHICLQTNCFKHFMSAEKLLAHLESKHSLTKKYYNDQQDILRSYKNMYNSELFLMCVECEHVFNESDEFTHHLCSDYIKPCNVCGLRQKCDHSNKRTSNNRQKSQQNRNRKRPPPKKTNNVCLTPPSEFVPPIIIAKTPDRKSLQTLPSTPASGGELKMKFKFSRVDSNKNSPCKITVESPLSQSDGITRLNGDQIVDQNINKNLNSEFTSPTINPPFLTPQMTNFDENICRSAILDSSINVTPESYSFDKPELFPLSPFFNNNAEVSFDQIQDKENASQNKELAPVTSLLHSTPVDTEQQDEPQPLLVPKLKLQIPKNIVPVESEESSTESDVDEVPPQLLKETSPVKDIINAENIDKEPSVALTERCVTPTNLTEEPMEIEPPIQPYDGIEIADDYTQLHDLQMVEPLDKIDLCYLLRLCLTKTIPYCLYCYHARRIAVCGRGLALHLIGNHRFQATVDSITAEELKPQTFVSKFKSSLDELENIYLNLDTYNSLTNVVEPVSYQKDTFYECMQCRFTTGTHKELYVHNRKLHLKSKLICIMCKIPFYSFCELISHMCPGVSNKHTVLDFEFRCCVCNMDRIPSAFRLMIHVRKRHFACDVCLEECNETVKLSSHVWKHKLHHLCYRCGIAYRNKADIQKHLFWRHGTESVPCKKCLLKRWSHVYHFCIPPAIFYCDICSMEFTRAVSLRVHKRIHNNFFPYPCTEEGCEKKFIAKKLLLKHLDRHNGIIEPPVEEQQPEQELTNVVENKPEEKGPEPVPEAVEPVKRVSKKRRKREDILALISGIEGPNLSESDSSDDSENDSTPSPTNVEQNEQQDVIEAKEKDKKIEDNEKNLEEPCQNVDIWENFKSFQEAQGNPVQIDALEENESVLPNPDSTKDTIEPELLQETPSDVIPQTIEQPPVEPVVRPESPTIPKPILKPEKSDEDLYRTTKFELYTCQSDHDYCIMFPPKINLFVDDFENEIGASIIRDNARLLREAEERQAALQAEQRAKFFRAGSSPRSSPPRKSPPRKRRVSSSSSSSSSSGSSSSCSCGSSCSCSSSSSSSSSDSDSDDENNAMKRAKKQQVEQEQIVPIEPPQPIDPDSIMLECDLDTDESETDEEFYDEHPQKLANQQLAEKRRQLMLQTCMDPENADGIIENSRPSTPSLPDEIVKEKKMKLKKKKRDKKQKQDTPIKQAHIPVAPVDPLKLYESFTQSYVQEFQAAGPAPPVKPSIAPVPLQDQTTEMIMQHLNEPLAVQPYHQTALQLYQSPKSLLQDSPMPSALQIQQQAAFNSSLSTSFGAESTPNSDAAGRTKRKRVPNKFYGYDDVDTLVEKNAASDPYQPPPLVWDKDDLPSTPKPQRPTSKRPSSAKNPASRANSRVNSLERNEDTILPPVIIKNAQITPTRTVEPLKITLPLLRGTEKLGNVFTGASDDSSDNLSIVQTPTKQQQQKIPKIKLGTLKKSKTKSAAPSSNKVTKPRQRKPTASNAKNERTGPRIINAPAPTNIQLEQYPSSFSQPLYPTPPASAVIQPQPHFPIQQQQQQPTIISSNPYYREGYPIQRPANWRPAKEGEKVYCYCRCPYDEVSEMIGCDDDNCRVEWFHFECVGILMAPTGKWYCPDCKPRHMHEFATDYPDSSGSY